jgi:transcriptional regulator with XRE-family HTH domain
VRAAPARAGRISDRSFHSFESEELTMATVHCDRDCREDDEDDFGDPLAVADVEHSDVSRAAHDAGGMAGDRTQRRAAYHRIAEVRRSQGVTLRNVARRLGLSLPVVRRQECADCDLRLSDLQCWQEVLEVPIAELLVEGEGQLSGPVLERSRMVKLMKTAAAIRERTEGTPVGRMVTMLIEQILEIMPELTDVGPWHSVGQRRPLDDLGRAARMAVSEDLFGRSGS